MIKWNVPTEPLSKPVKAFKCPLNPGVIDDLGNQVNHPSRIWVDDILIAAVGVENMEMALATVIEAIFVVLGGPDTKSRQCPLAMDTWAKLIVAEEQLGLSLIIDTRKMSLAITRKYLNDTLRMIQTV